MYERFLDTVAEAEGKDQMVVGRAHTEAGSALILVGAHGKTALCWCQPVVLKILCDSGRHFTHDQVNHRRTMDQSVLDDDNEMGFSVQGGDTYPLGQVHGRA